MSPERAKELLPIIAAFAEGKNIQVKGTDEVWFDKTDIIWVDWCQYRIKPEQRTPYQVYMDAVYPNDRPHVDGYYPPLMKGFKAIEEAIKSGELK